MKNKTLHFILIVFLLVSVNLTQAFSQEPPKQLSIKGQWTFYTEVTGMQIDIHALFKKNNTGFVIGGTEGKLPLIYNQKNNLVKVIFETPALAYYSDVTVIFNGTFSDNNNISGNATVITNQPDPLNPNGFFTFTLVITGQRDKTLTQPIAK